MSLCSDINTRDAGRRPEKVQNHEPESICHSAKTIHQNDQVLNSPENSQNACSSNRRAPVLTCIRGQVWIATQKCWLCSWKKFRTPKNDAAEKWPESVTVQLCCQNLTVFIRWSRRSIVDPANMLSTKLTLLSLQLDVLVVCSKLTRALGKFAVIHLICFILATILEEKEWLSGTLFETKSPLSISRLWLQLVYFRKLLWNDNRILFEWNSCKSVQLLWLSTT